MKYFFSVLCLFCFCEYGRAQLAFRVSEGGLEEPSYIFGTIHTLPGSILDTCQVYLQAEKSCCQLFVESKNDKQIKEERVEIVKEALILPDSMTILDVLGEERMNLLENRLQECHININDSSSLDIWRMRPVFYTTILNNVLTVMALIANPTVMASPLSGKLIDITTISRAENRGWEIFELDRISQEKFQSNIEELFNSSSIQEQEDSLMALVVHFDERKEQTIKEYAALPQMMDYWHKGDYQGLENNYSSMIEKDEIIFANRNRKWLPVMIEAMHEKPTLFVFGAGHLIGHSGIIHLLQEAGYKIEQIR